MAAPINRDADLERAAQGMIRAGRPEGYVAGWVAAWLGHGHYPADEHYERGFADGEAALERNAAIGGRF